MKKWMKSGVAALSMTILVACVAQSTAPPRQKDTGATRTLLNKSSNETYPTTQPLKKQHPVFGEVGTVFGGDLLPFVRANSRRPILSFADRGRATVIEIPALRGADYVRLSRGGRFAVFEEQGEIGIYDLKTQLIQTFPELSNRRSDIRLMDVDAYGNLTYLDDLGRVHILNTATKQDYIVPAAGRARGVLNGLSLAGNGRAIAFSNYSSGGHEILLTDLGTGRQFSFPFLNNSRDPLRAFELSSDGRCLLFQQGDRIKVLNTQSGMIDNLALLNSGPSSWPTTLGYGQKVYGAAFLDGQCERILFERNGQIQIFDRNTGLIDTLPILNRVSGTHGLLRHRGWQFSPLR